MMNKILSILSLLISGILMPAIGHSQQQEVVFYDDFNDNRNKWHIGEDQNTAFDIRNGYYYFSSKRLQTTWFRYNPNVTTALDKNKDFLIEWSYIQVEGTNDWASGLICLFDSEAKNTYGLWINSGGDYGITQGPNTLNRGAPSVIAKGNNVTNTARIIKKGRTISFVINGQEVYTCPYNDLSIMHVGFQIGSIKTIAIDYLKVAYLPEDKTAPSIVITNPLVSRGLKVTKAGDWIEVTGKASDESGVDAVSINGSAATVDFEGNFKAKVSLQPGDNAINVVATDKKRNLGNFRFVITRGEENIVPVLDMDVVEKPGKYYALLMGIQDYNDEAIPDLDQPVIDASSLNTALLTKYTFEKENTTLLKNPSREQIFDALENLAKKITPTDNLLIFYAGHGYWDEVRKQGYWFPSDARKLNRSTWLTNADLKEYIGAIRSKHTLLITDACFAGSIFKSRSVMGGASLAIKQLYEFPSRKAMTSGTLKEVSDKSVFIEYLVKRLNQNTEKYLSAEQLFSSFKMAVINNSANGQVPQFGEIKEAGDEGGDFIFIKR